VPAAALPCVVVGAAALCEQVPNGRSINYNCTACQPTLGKKPIKDWEKFSIKSNEQKGACSHFAMTERIHGT